MGVTLRCGKKTMSLPYSTWNKFRECLFLLARQYILDHHETFLEKKGLSPSYKDRIQRLRTTRGFPGTVSLLKRCDIQDLFNVMKLGGIVPLILKNDNEGFYTPGNSLDMSITFHTLQQLVKKETWTMTLVKDFRDILQDSIQHNRSIEIG
jgi:hypothetical protein